MDSSGTKPQETPPFWPYDFDELLRAAGALEGLRKAVGAINPRPAGWHNDLIQLFKKLLARLLGWYTRPLGEFNASVTRSLKEIAAVLDHLSMNMVALDQLSMNAVALENRLAQSEKRTAARVKSIEEQLALLLELVEASVSSQKTAYAKAPARRMETEWDKRAPDNSPLYIDTGLGIDRTAYVIGLFGSGRHYINELMLQNIGERARYFRDTIRLHPGPTPMIYSGHATMKYVSRLQALPDVTNRVLEAVRSGFADLIFVYRHPLDSLLTNWIWWRTYLRDHTSILGISEAYKDTDDLCADLEQNFAEFKAFAEGAPEFFVSVPSPRFLSFPEFVEETELHIQSATLALRLEDCVIDPRKEFSRIVEVMSVDLDLSGLSVARPRTKPYGYAAVSQKVPRFRSFIDGLNTETKRRIEKIGYKVTV